ncbi:hypothetical protein [Immundisolibacter sp.]
MTANKKPSVLEPEMKIALVLDNYKWPNRADYWAKGMKETPWVEECYVLDRETTGMGITAGTMISYRHYKLKEGVK